MKIESLAGLYEMHYSADKSEHTLKAYRLAWTTYKEFMSEKFNLVDEHSVIMNTTWSTAQMFKNWIIQKDLNPKTINNMLSGLRQYFNILLMDETIEKNPFSKVASMSTSSVDYQRPFLTEDEFEPLLETIGTKVKGKKQDAFELTSARDQLAVGILLSSGLRISELLNIKMGEIKEDGSLTVLGKGKKLREVRISQKNMARLHKYLEVRQQYAQEDCDNLFISRYGKKPSPQSFNKNLKGYLDRAGLDTEVSAHSLRKSCATRYLRNGVDINRIAKMLGHSNIATTQIYAKAAEEMDFID